MNDKEEEIVVRITGKCSCHESYKSRGLIAPDCVFHECGEEITDLIRDYESRLTTSRPITMLDTSPSAHELALAEAVGHIAVLTAFRIETPAWQHASKSALEFIARVPIDWKGADKAKGDD
jgi:hypothetical protein